MVVEPHGSAEAGSAELTHRAASLDEEEAAARAYDLAALKYWGHDTILDFLVLLPSYSSVC